MTSPLESAEAPRPGPLPLWAWPIAGLCLGLILSLALTRGGLPLAIGVVIGIAALATKPWTRRRNGLDRRHEMLAASSPLRSTAL